MSQTLVRSASWAIKRTNTFLAANRKVPALEEEVGVDVCHGGTILYSVIFLLRVCQKKQEEIEITLSNWLDIVIW